MRLSQSWLEVRAVTEHDRALNRKARFDVNRSLSRALALAQLRGLRNCIGPDGRSQRSVRQWPKKIFESAQPSPAVVIRDRGQSYINPLLAERKPQYSKTGNRVAVSPRRRSRDGETMLKPKICGIEFFRTAKLVGRYQ